MIRKEVKAALQKVSSSSELPPRQFVTSHRNDSMSIPATKQSKEQPVIVEEFENTTQGEIGVL